MNTTLKTAIVAILLLVSATVAFASVDAEGDEVDTNIINNENDLKAAVSKYTDVKLGTDITITQTIELGDLNIDVNGHAIKISDGANVSGTGSIICNMDCTTTNSKGETVDLTYFVQILNGSINGINFINNGEKLSVHAYPPSGDITIKNCKFYGNGLNGNAVAGIYVDLEGTDKKVLIDNCDFYGIYGEGSVSLQKAGNSTSMLEFNKIDEIVLHIWGNNPRGYDEVIPVTYGTNLSFIDSEPPAILLENFDYDDETAGTTEKIESELVIPEKETFTAKSITGDGKITAQPGSKVLVENISVPVEGEGEVIITDKPTPPVDEDDEFPFIPGQGSSSNSDDTTTYIAVAAAAAVVAVLAVLVMAMSKGKL